jgi:MFS family permease
VGYLSDLLGRRYVAIAGSSLICAGAAVSSTAKSMIVFISMRLSIQVAFDMKII